MSYTDTLEAGHLPTEPVDTPAPKKQGLKEESSEDSKE